MVTRSSTRHETDTEVSTGPLVLWLVLADNNDYIIHSQSVLVFTEDHSILTHQLLSDFLQILTDRLVDGFCKSGWRSPETVQE